MEKVTLFYHVSVMLMSIIIFFMEITAPHWLAEFIYKTLGKLIPIFCILYSGIQIFKIFGII